MKIHFVCHGNVFRSRIAEAYLKSKHILGIEVTSSGTHASENESGPVSWNAGRILKNNNLISFMSIYWQNSTKKLLEDAQLVIFVEQKIFDWTKNNLNPSLQKYVIWNIPDINEYSKNIDEDIQVITSAEEIFGNIKKEVDNLHPILAILNGHAKK